MDTSEFCQWDQWTQFDFSLGLAERLGVESVPKWVRLLNILSPAQDMNLYLCQSIYWQPEISGKDPEVLNSLGLS